MTTTHPEPATSLENMDLPVAAHPRSGTEDDDDDRNDEQPAENEALVRETDEQTEAPEEFQVDEEDTLSDAERPNHDQDEEEEEKHLAQPVR